MLDFYWRIHAIWSYICLQICHIYSLNSIHEWLTGSIGSWGGKKTRLAGWEWAPLTVSAMFKSATDGWCQAVSCHFEWGHEGQSAIMTVWWWVYLIIITLITHPQSLYGSHWGNKTGFPGKCWEELERGGEERTDRRKKREKRGRKKRRHQTDGWKGEEERKR